MKLNRSKDFKQEIDTWLQENLISQHQHSTLVTRYELDKEAAWYMQTNFIIQSVAFLLAAMGVILLISYNWDILPIPMRMLCGLLPLLAAYGAGFYFFTKSELDKSELAFVFACMLFGANIALQAQIFHISSYYPDGILWWILGSLPVMIFFRSTFLNCLLQFLFMMWLQLQNQYGQFQWLGILIMLALVYQNYVNTNALGYLFMFFTGGYFILNFCNLFAAQSLYGIDPEILHPSFACGYMLAYAGLLKFVSGAYSEKFVKRISSLMYLGVAFYTFLLTFTESISGLAEWNILPLFLIMGALFLAVGLVLNWLHDKNDYDTYVVFLMAIFCSLLPFVSPDYVVYAMYFANLLFLAYGIWCTYSGIKSRQKGYFMYGLFLLLVWSLARFIYLIGDYLIAGLLFIGIAMALLFINKQWNKKYAQ